MNSDLPSTVLDILREAGWFEGRRVTAPLPTELQPFPVAQDIFAEFGGLHFGHCGTGIDWATNDILIDPSIAAHVMPELRAMEASIKMRLFPLGEVHRGHCSLIVDEEGRTYLLTDELEPLAPTFARCLELLLLGKKPSPEEIEATWGGNSKRGHH